MTAEQISEYLLSHSRRFERDVIRDTDRHGEGFCELIIKNDSNPSCPITVTVTDEGSSISVGSISNVTGSKKMSPDQTLGAIEDIIADKIVFILGYRDDDDLGFGSPFLSRVFALTGGDDDMGEEYDDFIKTISTPINKRLRFFYSMKGRFLIFNYSGSLNKTIIR
jgi:hypothetical protein